MVSLREPRFTRPLRREDILRVLVTFAIAQEFAPWRALRVFHPMQYLGVPVQATRIGDVEAHVLITGMGGVRAAGAARTAFANQYDACISTGLAGGLKHIHPTGRVLVARTVRAGIGDEFFATDSRLRRLAAVCGARVVDAFYSSERMLITAREKSSMGLLADAVEMESYAILEEARKWHVPAVAIRVISDGAGEDLPLDFNRTISRRGRINVLRLLGQLAQRPEKVRPLLRLARESRRAATKLGAFLDSYLEALAGLSHEESSLTHKVTG